MDIFDNQASEFTFVRSYARWMDDANKRESWPETVERVVKFLAEERGDLIPEKTLKKIGTYMLDLSVMPSMRLTWTAGDAARKDNSCIYNCFSRGTEFITDRGVLSFNDFDNGDNLTVLTHLGNWKDATVKCFGKQKIDSIELWRGSNSKSVFVEATENHNWILKDGTRTTSIDVGDLLYHAPQLQFDYDNSTPEEKLYWCYGYVYGDGTNVKYDGEYRYSMVRLCNKDSSFKKRFEEMGFKTSTSHSLNGDFMAYTGSYLKTLPSLENDPVNLIAAFVNGLLAADGTKKRNNGKTRYVSIQATGKESCDFLKAALPMCGFYITRIDDFSNQTTNLGKRGDLTLRFIIDDKTCQHSNCIWKVKSIQKAVKEENVWCLTVDCDESFVLPFGVSTGNCAFTPIDSVESFAEILFILMCGCGIAFSVTREHISKLPSVPSIDTMHQIPASIEDSREGWADSVKFLMNNLFRGRDVHFDYSRLRPEGARLHTMGGRSSGPAPLINLHTFIRNTFISAQGRHLLSIECHDIANQIAEAVIVGGVRRSSEMSLSDLDDQAMATAKVPPFPPRRYMANNSAVYYEKPSAVEFLKEWSILASSGSGERGIFNLDSARKKCPTRRDGKRIQGVNPCGEIMLRARQFCNLSEVVCKANDDLDTLLDKVETAAWLGAIQSTFTDFPYLSNEWKKNCEEERLMGVSLTGICDCDTVRNPVVLNALRNKARKVARHAAKKLGINYAAAVTCVKPSGTVSQLVNSASGIHPRYSQYYIRRYRISKMDPLFHMMVEQGIPFVPDNGCDPDDPATLVCEFPIKSPAHAILRNDMGAMDQLELYKMLQENWCEHNASCTIYVKDHEWFEVGNWVYQNWDIVNGLSFLPYDNGHYQLAPYEEIDEATYLAMASAMPNIDYSQLSVFETEDKTEGAKTLACSGGSCELT